MSDNEIGLREARTQLGEIANRAHLTGETTYLMRNGRRIAAVVPVGLAQAFKDLGAAGRDASEQLRQIINLIPQEEQTVTTITFTRPNDEHGTDTITISATDTEVTEAWTTDGITGKDISSFAHEGEVQRHLHDRRIDLRSDGYTEQ